MPNRAALVTGASRGIGRAIAELLGEEGYDLTIAARRPASLQETAEALRGHGYNVEHVAANLADEEGIQEVVARHRDRYGRLDVLVNNAGVGIGAAAGEHQTKFVGMQLDVNVRSIVLFYRECLRPPAGRRHRAPQRPGREPGVDRREVAPAVAVGVLGDEGGGDRLHGGDE